MPSVNDDQVRAYLHELLATMNRAGASDLFIANDFPPSMKVHGSIQPMLAEKLTGEVTRQLAHAMMSERQREEFARELECNFAVSVPGVARFRVNVLVQRQHVGMVFRTIPAEIPGFDTLGLPGNLKDIVMQKRGLVLVVGGAGSGRSTLLAAMIDHRNRAAAGHSITIEDPVEFEHAPRRCLVTQREVGVDTHSWQHALENALRQAPDVVLIGEIRDADTMGHAMAFPDTGQLCLGTLHANTSSQALDRILNFFPGDRHKQLLKDISGNLRAIIAQRLIPTADGSGRVAAVEILINTPAVAERILNGEFNELKPIMDKSRELGMRTFDWSLFGLYTEGHISYDDAILNADSANELRLNIKLKSPRGEPAESSGVSLTLEALEEVLDEKQVLEARQQEILRQQEQLGQLEQRKLDRLRAQQMQLLEEQRRTT